MAIIDSDYEGKKDKIETLFPIIKGSTHYLERGENVVERPTIQALAKHIISLVN